MLTPETQKPHPAGKQSEAPYRKRRRPSYTDDPPYLEKISAALAFIPAYERETWLKVGMALKAELGDGGFSTWDAWSQQADSYRERDATAVWKSIKPGKVTIGTLFFLAKENGWRPGRDHFDAPSQAEIEERKQRQRAEAAKRESDEHKRHQIAAIQAGLIWSRATPCTEHPYLARKHVGAHGLRAGAWERRYQDQSGIWGHVTIEGTLLVPMSDENGELWNLQAIFTHPLPELGRDKDFLSGRKAGLFHVLGDPTDALLIAEGYATAATVHEATGLQTYVAFDCGNLAAVACIVRDRYPGQRITICADDDRHTLGNPGATKARAAALAVGGFVAVPDFPPGVEGTDWNDLHVYRIQGGLRHGRT